MNNSEELPQSENEEGEDEEEEEDDDEEEDEDEEETEEVAVTDGESNGEPLNSAMILLSNLSSMLTNGSLRLTQGTSSGDMNDNNVRVKTTYDKTLAAKHEYLGTDLEEVRGRTLHDEGSIVTLPILMELEIVLVPGQTLPLTALYPPTISMFRKIIAKDKTFGVMCVSSSTPYGTTAEIFQYQEDNDLAGFKIKAKGRQRFKLLEHKQQTRGILSGKVLILPEISLVNPLHCPRFTSLDRFRGKHSNKLKTTFYDAVPTPWPSWVYRQYDTRFLVDKVTKELNNLKTDDVRTSNLPTDPVDLSYWVAQCLPIDGNNRIKMLMFNTAIERLQYAMTLMTKGQKFYCSHCGDCIADRKDVFSISIDGPQGMYVNPGGHVYEIITVYKVLNLSLVNEAPSTECSWFPGYGWTIAQCSNCDCHMGWLFTAVKKNLKPKKFWGLSRRSVTTHRKCLLDLLV